MQQYCYITVRDVPPFFDYDSIVTYSEIEKVNSINEIKHPAARECLRYMDVKKGVSVLYEGDLPARTGIGSSSSFTVGLLNALHAYNNSNITKFDLASEAIYVEQKILKENVGVQDQIMASYGGIRLIDLGPNDRWRASKMYLSSNYMKEFESHIMLGFSGVSRYAEEQSKVQVTNIKEGKSEMELRATVALAHDAIDSIGREDEMHVLGGLLNLGWSIKRKLADGISKDWIDEIYNKAMNAGAYGGKLMGAGGGGFFMFLAPPDAHERIKLAIPEINVWVPFKFDYEGSTIIME